MSCRRRMVRAGKRMLKGITAPLVAHAAKVADMLDGVPAETLSNEDKREILVSSTIGKATREKIGEEVKEGAIRALVEVVLDAVREGGDALDELGQDDGNEITETF